MTTIARTFAINTDGKISTNQYNADMDVLFRMVNQLMPAGTIVSTGVTTAPVGWILCDGSSYGRKDYPELFAAIGTAYGTADSTHFNVPDLRGRFLRGWASGQTTDPDKATRTAITTGGATGDNIGSLQEDAFQGHYHRGWGSVFGAKAELFNRYVMDGADVDTGLNTAKAPTDDGTNGTPRLSLESRPKNVNVNFMIKY